MPSSWRRSRSNRNKATESAPPETAIPRRSPASSRLSRRMWSRAFSARECTETCYNRVGTAEVSAAGVFLQPRFLLGDQLSDLLHELGRQHVFGFFFPAGADVDFAGLGFFIADNQ